MSGYQMERSRVAQLDPAAGVRDRGDVAGVGEHGPFGHRAVMECHLGFVCGWAGPMRSLRPSPATG
jgi:hypothetical protein